MARHTIIKLALALVGLALFAAGVRFENERLRWAAIATVAVAFLMRLATRNRDG